MDGSCFFARKQSFRLSFYRSSGFWPIWWYVLSRPSVDPLFKSNSQCNMARRSIMSMVNCLQLDRHLLNSLAGKWRTIGFRSSCLKLPMTERVYKDRIGPNSPCRIRWDPRNGSYFYLMLNLGLGVDPIEWNKCHHNTRRISTGANPILQR